MKKQLAVIVLTFFLLLLPFFSCNTQAEAVNPTWTIQTVQQGQTAWLSLALDANDVPCIGNGDIYATWNGSNWTTQFIDSSGSFYSDSFLVLDAQGIPHVCCGSSSGLKYAILNGSTWITQTVDSMGICPSLVLDKKGTPHISYRDKPNAIGTEDVLKYAVLSGSGWAIQTVDSGGWLASLALDSSGNPNICYSSNIDDVLNYAVLGDSGWSIQTIADDSYSAERHNGCISLALDSSGNPHVAYKAYAKVMYAFADLSLDHNYDSFWFIVGVTIILAITLLSVAFIVARNMQKTTVSDK